MLPLILPYQVAWTIKKVYIDRTDPPVMSCSYSLTITISAGTSSANGVVTIINDTIYEGLEDFFLDLSVAPPFQDIEINEGSPLRSRVEIEDEDGKSEFLQF